MRALFLSLFACLGSTPVTAAPDEGAPPSIIEITTVDGAAQDSEAFLFALRRSDDSSDPSDKWVVGKPISGELDRYLLISFHPNFADLQQWHARLQSAEGKVSGKAPKLQSSTYKYNPSVSYNPRRVGMGDAGAMSLLYFYLRRGGTDGFVAEQRLAKQLLERAKVSKETFLGYGLSFGAKAPAYVFIAPLKDLSDLDVDLSHLHDTLFTPAQDEHRGSTLRQSVEGGAVDLMVVREDLSKR